VAGFALLPAEVLRAAAFVFRGPESRLSDFFDLAFFGDLFADLRELFFAGGFLLAAFLAFFTTRLPVFFARFFDADALATVRRFLRTFFVLRFLTAFFLGAATTISFMLKIVGNDCQRSA
jgi:hypothetical protein